MHDPGLQDLRQRISELQSELARSREGRESGGPPFPAALEALKILETVSERMAKQEMLLRAIIDAMPALVAYVGADGRFRYVNQRYWEWYRRPTEQIEGKSIEEALGAERASAVKPRVERALKGETVTAVGLYGYSDRARWIRAIHVPDAMPDGRVQGVVTFVEDITEAHRAEEEVRRSEEQYRFLANALPQIVWIANSDGETEFLNDSWYEYTGASREEGIRAWGRTVLPDDADAVARAWRRAGEQRTPFDIEFRIERHADRMRRWHLARIKPILTAEGAIAKWIGTALDIHDRKNSELELAKARRDVVDILESISESFIAVDREWRFVYVNRRVSEKLGIKREDLIGRNMWEVAPEAVASAFYPNYQRVMHERIPLQFEMPYPPDRWFDVHAHPTEMGMSAYVVDKTEQKRTEEALRQKAKLESIGLVAGGVAHDFNNLLVGILGAASLAQEMIGPDRPEHDIIRLIADSAERAAHLTAQLLTYAGRRKAEKQAVDLNRVVQDTVQLLQSTIPSHVQVRADLAPGLPRLAADPGQIQQVVINLLTNAIEAIPKNAAGEIAVRTSRKIEASPRQVGIERLDPGEFLLLEVRDSGQGIAPDMLDRIFDPFFTTKFTGRGLGLAAVQGIVRNHQGAVLVESEPGRGTKFEILLRRTELEDAPEPAAEPPLTAGQGTVLVIDDEPAVRATCERILQSYGFRVIAAPDAAEGIRQFRERRANIAAVVVDLSMPGRSGLDVLRDLAEDLKGVPVVLSSGHSEQDISPELAQFPSISFLQKPYRAQQLLRALEAALQAAGRSSKASRADLASL